MLLFLSNVFWEGLMINPWSTYQALWRKKQGALPNTIALLYATLGHACGIYLMLQENSLSLLAGIVLTGHSMIICAYLVHEAAHMTLFRSKNNNAYIGELLLWIIGAAYASFNRVRHMHLRHHQDHADVSCFNYQALLNKQPKLVKQMVIAMEWAYIPAIELIMHAQVIIRPFFAAHLKQHRQRVIWVGLSRIAFFSLIFFISPLALMGYLIAYLIMLQALFLADAFAHTYEAFFVARQDDPIPANDRNNAYDTAHTYSNLFSHKYPWLNLINLNFGYHTAHHDRASVAWHDLPSLHRKLYGNKKCEQILPYRELLGTIHRNRIKRIFVDDYGDVKTGPDRAENFVGAHGVSFLSIV
jgi:fatty acid desaturase